MVMLAGLSRGPQANNKTSTGWATSWHVACVLLTCGFLFGYQHECEARVRPKRKPQVNNTHATCQRVAQLVCRPRVSPVSGYIIQNRSVRVFGNFSVHCCPDAALWSASAAVQVSVWLSSLRTPPWEFFCSLGHYIFLLAPLTHSSQVCSGAMMNLITRRRVLPVHLPPCCCCLPAVASCVMPDGRAT